MAISGVHPSQSISGLENGTDRLRGLEDAAVQRAQREHVVSPPVVVEMGRPKETAATYAPPHQRAEGVANAAAARVADNAQAAERATADVHASTASAGTLVAAGGGSGRAGVKIDALAAASSGKVATAPVTPAAASTPSSSPVHAAASALRAFEAVQPLEARAVKQASGQRGAAANSADRTDKLEDPRWAAYRRASEQTRQQDHGQQGGGSTSQRRG